MLLLLSRMISGPWSRFCVLNCKLLAVSRFGVEISLSCFRCIWKQKHRNNNTNQVFFEDQSLWDVFGFGIKSFRASSNAKEVRLYLNRARKRIVYAAAARAWACGVDYSEALSIAHKAVEASSSANKGKGKGKGKGKVRGRFTKKGKWLAILQDVLLFFFSLAKLLPVTRRSQITFLRHRNIDITCETIFEILKWRHPKP